MPMRLAVFVFGLSFIHIAAKSYTNPFVVQQLFKTELDLMNIMKDSSFASNTSLLRYKEKMRQIHDDLQDDQRNRSKNILEKLVSNPLHVFGLMRRMIFFWPMIYEELFIYVDEEAQRLVTAIQNRLLTSPWPDNEDYIGSLMSLARIQHVYRLSIDDLARGRISGRQTMAVLDVEDLHAIASHRAQGVLASRPGLNGPEWAVAVEWAEAAIRLLDAGVVPAGTTSELVKQVRGQLEEELKSYSIQHDDGYEDFDSFQRERWFSNLLNETEVDEVRRAEHLRGLEKESPKTDPDTKNVDVVLNYYDLCRNSKVNGPPMTCNYHSNGDVYARLAPQKVEDLSSSPLIKVHHDSLSEKDIDMLKIASMNKLSSPSNQRDNQIEDSFQLKIDVTQAMETASLNMLDQSRFHNLRRKIERIFGFRLEVKDGKTDDSEDLFPQFGMESFQEDNVEDGGLHELQVEVFPAGGHQFPRKIFNFTEDPINPVMTTFIQLSEVSHSGIAFPLANTIANIPKRSLLFLSHLDSDGNVDEPSIVYGSCPTTFGVQWVSKMEIWTGLHRHSGKWDHHICRLEPLQKKQKL